MIFNAEEVKKCLEDVVGEDKEYALWLLEWAINKRSFDLEEYRKQIRAEAFDEFINQIEKQTTFYCGKDSNLRRIAEQLKEQDYRREIMEQEEQKEKDCNNCANATNDFNNEVDTGCYMCCKGLENNYVPIK